MSNNLTPKGKLCIINGALNIHYKTDNYEVIAKMMDAFIDELEKCGIEVTKHYVNNYSAEKEVKK